MKKTTIASLIGLAFSTHALAATLDADQVKVTANRVHEDIQNISANIQVITREDIQEINALSVPQVLSQLGGLNVTGTALGQFNRGATIDIGGYGATAGSTTLVLINGQRLTPVDQSTVPWEIIPVVSIDRIEIIKGSAGVQYGDGAVGGVINIITNEGQQSLNQVTATAGSFGTIGTSAIFQNKYNDTVFKFSGSANHSDGWRQNTVSDQYSGNARITQFFDQNSVYLEIFGNHNKNETPGPVIGLVNQGASKALRCDANDCNIGAFYSFDNYGVGAGSQFSISSKTNFEVDLSYKDSKSFFDKPIDAYGIGSGVSQSAHYDRSHLDFSPRLKFDLEKYGNLIIGYDHMHADGSSNTNDPATSSVSLSSNAGYINYRLPISYELEIAAGGRRQVEDISASQASSYITGNDKKSTSANAWEVALNYKISSNEKVYIKYGQSFRFPNIDEYWAYDYTNHRAYLSEIMVPQLDRTSEIGANIVLGNTRIKTSLFHTRTEHEIRLQGGWTNINDPDVIERNGVNLSTVSLITDRLSLNTNSKLQEATYVSGQFNGKSFDLVPHLLINARLNYQLDNDWSFGASTNYVGRQYYDGANDAGAYTKMPSYVVTDLYANRKIGYWDIRATVKNVANEHYATYGGYSSGLGNYYYYPSDPRSVFASVSYNF